MNVNLFRSAVHIAAICGLYLSIAMAIPALIDLHFGHRDWTVFVFSGLMTGGLSLGAALATSGTQPPFNKRFGFILVNILWLCFSLIGALPIYLSSVDLSFAQALFESVSAITTTGGTVISGLDRAPPGLLLWRSMLCWFGGIGIVALGLFVLPFLHVGGIAFFKMESSDTNDRPFARLGSFIHAFLAIYVLLTVICTVAYDLAGMSHFDALNHAMSTVATAGFSTHDASFAFFDNTAILWISSIFLTLGSLPFSVMILFAVRGRLDTLRDPQIIVFLGYLSALSLAVAAYHHVRNEVAFGDALTHSVFNMASILSTGGFASEDYTLWGPFVVVVAFFATFVGGCSGSTAGGIKAYRLIILFSMFRSGLRRLIYPNGVFSIRYGNIIVDDDMQRAVVLYLIAFLSLWVAGSLAMACLGYDFLTATSAVATSLANVGPGIGPTIGPAGNFSTLSAPALHLLSFFMLLGRLEILTVLVLAMPTFWRS
ncbi:TrkH family potassium uptake protein [Rhizobium sp. LjRoot30]|uniref:TrkH family potassium uptake protein n=1 Tax=Rhizobium sp. LjRoot30 TaxID=3342320 RepID=UPI003ECC2B31